MDSTYSTLGGLWLPLVTPFRDGTLDERSLRKLVTHYAAQPIDGFILGATTGEGTSLDDEEAERLVSIARETLQASGMRVPLYFGLSGADTRKTVQALERTASWDVSGYLVTSPYYTKPSQRGLLSHFSALAESTARPILIYNIPYRTGVNISNETMLELAECSNIVGVKDCSADPEQSFDFLRHRPAGFAVLTGEDHLFYGALTLGADGGIIASAHVRPQAFAAVRNKLIAGDQAAALASWKRIADLPRLLFAEPSPAPIKYWLWREGLIYSPEMRLPMVPVTAALASRIDQAMAGESGTM